MTEKTAPARRPRHARDEETPVVEMATEPRCNLAGCGRTPEWRGLCAAHRQTHRGLADPKPAPVQFQPEPIHTREARNA